MDKIDFRTGTWNWFDVEGQTPGTPVGLLAYTRDPSPGHSVQQIVDRAIWLSNMGDLRPLIRFDYRPGQTAPMSDLENIEFIGAVDWAFGTQQFAGMVQAGKIQLSAFNEPNNPGEGSFSPDRVSRYFNGYGWSDHPPEQTFCSKVRAERNGGETAKIWAPAPNCYGSGYEGSVFSTGIEASPWAEWASTFWLNILHRNGMWNERFDGYLLHAYGRLDAVPEDEETWEPFHDTRSEQDWRFGFNIVDTWFETLRRITARETLPVFFSEVNTLIDDSWPVDNYPTGWIGHARDRIINTFGPQATGMMWFVGDGEVTWAKTALNNPDGRMPRVAHEYLAIQQMEDSR